MKGYDRERWRTQVNRNLYAEVQDDVDPLTRQRMTAAHQLGDALRVLGRYSLADSYYHDVMTAYPQNIRNLADLTKTYCLAGNWQRAEEFLWRVAFTHDTAYWNADINLHMGWALAGGVSESKLLYHRIDRLISKLYPQSTRDRETGVFTNSRIDAFGEAMKYLDFALHQRPRYITYWRQTDWHTPFDLALKSVNNINDGDDEKYIFDKTKPKPKQYHLWLNLRQQSLEATNVKTNSKDVEDFITYVTNTKYLQQFKLVYQNLRDKRSEIKSLINTIEDSKRMGGLRHTFRKLEMGKELYANWNTARTAFLNVFPLVEKPIVAAEIKRSKVTSTRTSIDHIKNQRIVETQNTTIEILKETSPESNRSEAPNFVERWATDVYAEIALLTARMLAEGGAYELVYEVASTTTEDLKKWLELYWQKHSNDDRDPEKQFTFSPRVFAFQRAALYGWKAYAAYQCKFDFLTNARIHADSELAGHLGEELRSLVINTSPSTDQILDGIQADLDAAREDITCVPLILFVQAKVYRSRQMYDHAVEEYERLLDLMEPYDPKRHIGANQFKNYSKAPIKDTSRNWMYYMEKVSGREQFEGIVNSPQVHVEIADIYRDLGKSDLRVKHLTEAIRHSPFNDVDVDNFLRLAEELNAMERYQEAEAVIEAVRLPSSQLHSIELSYTKRIAPDVMTCVINTRRMKYASAIRNCRQVARQFILHNSVSYEKILQIELEELRHRIKTLNEKTNNERNDLIKELESEISYSDKLVNAFKTAGELLKKDELPELRSIYAETIKFVDAKSAGDEHERNVWQFFQQLQEAFPKVGRKSILEAERISPYSLRQESMIAVLNKLGAGDSLSDKIIHGQILYFLSRQAGAGLAQLAEICNAIGYSRTESAVELHHAHENATWSITIMYYLLRWADPGTSRRSAIGLKLAQFSDTYGWLYYRDKMNELYRSGSYHRQPRSDFNQRLDRAEHFLKQGIRYDQRRAIIRYHLARLYLTRVELIWQATPDAILETSAGGRAKEIDTYITEALRQWRAAKEADTFGRLHSRLAWLYTRINRYKKAWEKREYRGIAGDPEANPDDLFDEPE